MSGTTSLLGLPYPSLTDPPNVPSDMQNLAGSVDTLFGATPLGGFSNSTSLGTADVRLSQSTRTTILSASFTLTRSQTVYVSAHARIDNSGTVSGDVGLTISADATPISGAQAGPIHVPKPNTGTSDLSADRVSIAIPLTGVTLAAGSHTITFEADRDGNAVLDAIAQGTINSRVHHPTSLTVIV